MSFPQLQSFAVVLHQSLLSSLVKNCESQLERRQKLAKAVHLCMEHRAQLYEYVFRIELANEDWITFFKSIKPLFVTELEYYHRLNHAHFFGCDEPGFYEPELRRMNKLLEEYKAFAEYYMLGHTNRDYAYFARGLAPLPTSLCMLPWETDPRVTSPRDAWVSGLLAVQRYRDWLMLYKPGMVHADRL